MLLDILPSFHYLIILRIRDQIYSLNVKLNMLVFWSLLSALCSEGDSPCIELLNNLRIDKSALNLVISQQLDGDLIGSEYIRLLALIVQDMTLHINSHNQVIYSQLIAYCEVFVFPQVGGYKHSQFACSIFLLYV